MSRKTWAIVAAVVVLAAAGTTTALLVSSSGDDSGPDYNTLPTCDKIAPLLPGQPTLKEERTTTQPLERGLNPAFMHLICTSADVEIYVSVDVYQASDMDLATAEQYADKAVHDSRSRAKSDFVRRNPDLDKLGADVLYSAHVTGESTCTAVRLKRNALVTVALPLTGDVAKSPDQFKAACRRIAKSQTSKVMDAAFGSA